MITIIGLSTKNAILIVELARKLRMQGMDTVTATLRAAKQRLRPIVMTSLAFTLGVVPLMLATGASDKTQHAIGTGVFGGMISPKRPKPFPLSYVVIRTLTNLYLSTVLPF